MRPYDKEIENIKKQIMDQYHPSDIILFGSCAKGAIHKGSDIDLCVILETADKRQTIRNMLLDVNYDIDLDIVVYTPPECCELKPQIILAFLFSSPLIKRILESFFFLFFLETVIFQHESSARGT